VAQFARALKRAGVPIDTVRINNALAALSAVDPDDEEQTYWVLRAALISRREHIPIFDAALLGVWDRARSGTGADASPGEGPADEPRRVEDVLDAAERSSEGEDEGEGADVGELAAADERLRELDFGEYDEEDLRLARGLIERIALTLPRRRTRRLEPARRGPVLDVRRTTQRALRSSGVPLTRQWRTHSYTIRRTILLLDVSGSMAAYSRPMVMFAQAAVRTTKRLEVFTFGTRLTRLTERLNHWDPERALTFASRMVPDWSGGTRIGESLRVFNEEYGRRGLSRGAAVVVVSDGWERGDPGLLEREMNRLARSAHLILWVNPLAGDPEYEPLAKGMAAALRHVDVFLPGHNLAALDGLARALQMLPSKGRRAWSASGPRGNTGERSG
jgi:uncharacterized protein with von Willebrand factor type A (vWA) domain